MQRAVDGIGPDAAACAAGTPLSLAAKAYVRFGAMMGSEKDLNLPPVTSGASAPAPRRQRRCAAAFDENAREPRAPAAKLTFAAIVPSSAIAGAPAAVNLILPAHSSRPLPRRARHRP